LVAIHCSFRKSIGPIATILNVVALWMNSSDGQPLWISQTMCGRKMKAAIAPAIHGHRVRNWRRSADRS
jgi:hypothetical protein